MGIIVTSNFVDFMTSCNVTRGDAHNDPTDAMINDLITLFFVSDVPPLSLSLV